MAAIPSENPTSGQSARPGTLEFESAWPWSPISRDGRARRFPVYQDLRKRETISKLSRELVTKPADHGKQTAIALDRRYGRAVGLIGRGREHNI